VAIEGFVGADGDDIGCEEVLVAGLM